MSTHLRPLALLLLTLGGLSAADLDPAFLKAEGWYLRNRAGSGEPVHLRGVNLGGWLVQERWMCPISTAIPGDANWWRQDLDAYLTGRFGTATKNRLMDVWQDAWITAPDFDALQALGMNCVRLPFSFLDFMEPEAASVALADVAWKEDAVAFRRLDAAIAAAAARGIYVILDLHEVQGRPVDPWTNPGSFWNTPAYQDRAVAIWQKVARRYVGHPWVAGYDLLNEPWSTAVSFYDRCYQAIRPIDPDHALFLETWGWDNLPVLAERGWTNVVCSLHYYPASGATLTQDITDHLADLRRLRDTQQASGKYVPMHIGEFYLNGATAAQWRQLINGYGELGVAWNKWTAKTHVVSGWGTYQRAADGRDPRSTTTDVPDITTDDADTIAARWARWVTPPTEEGSWSHLDLSNRRHTASPVVADDTLVVPASGSRVVEAAELLANDVSLNPDADLVLTDLGTPTHGRWVLVEGQRLYVAAPGFTGTDTVTYRVLDQTLSHTSATAATLHLTITAPTTGSAPVARPDTWTTTRDSPLTVTADGVLGNDLDPEGRTLLSRVADAPAQGQITLAPDGALTYQPAPGFTGEEVFTYVAVADGVASAPAQVTIRVLAPPPTNGGGLQGAYANGNGFPDPPLVVRTDPVIDLRGDGLTAPAPGVAATHFCVRWTGSLCPPTSGDYVLTARSDDAIRVYLDGLLVLDDWGAHGERDRSATVTLTGGTPVSLRVDFVQYGGDARAALSWTRPDGVSETIPADVLVPGSTAPTFAPVEPVIIRGPEVIPAPPALLTAAITGDGLRLSWTDQASNETNVVVERADDGGSFHTVATLSADIATWSDPAWPRSVAGSYRVVTINGAGRSPPSNVVRVEGVSPDPGDTGEPPDRSRTPADAGGGCGLGGGLGLLAAVGLWRRPSRRPERHATPR